MDLPIRKGLIHRFLQRHDVDRIRIPVYIFHRRSAGISVEFQPDGKTVAEKNPEK